MTPALRALRGNFPQANCTCSCRKKSRPLFQHLPWLDRVWPMPRRRGQRQPCARPGRSSARCAANSFDRSVDFASNDRGAILSFLIGARKRLGWAERGGFLGRQFCYNEPGGPGRIKCGTNPRGWRNCCRLGQLPPSSLRWNWKSARDPKLWRSGGKVTPASRNRLCHIASSQPKKEWPV